MSVVVNIFTVQLTPIFVDDFLSCNSLHAVYMPIFSYLQFLSLVCTLVTIQLAFLKIFEPVYLNSLSYCPIPKAVLTEKLYFVCILSMNHQNKS